MSTRYVKRKRRRGGPWVHFLFLIALVVGIVVGPPTLGDPETVQRQQERCAPIVWRHDASPQWERAWDTLRDDAGWTERAGRLTRPGCEGVVAP